MKKPKRTIIFLAFLLLSCWISQTALAKEEYSEWINPIWRHLPADHPFPQIETPKIPRSSIFCNSYAAFKSTLQQQFENRATSFVINLVYSFNFSEVESIITQACDEIMAADGYLGGNIYYRQTTWSGISGNVVITFIMTYWTSYEQEQLVTARVQEIIPQIIISGMDEEEKTKAIHDWIVLHVEYDQSYEKHSAYDALFDVKETVCQGYALLVIRMLREVNIESKFVSGYGNGGNHAWNLIYVCGKWYHLDATWDDPTIYPPNPDIIRWTYYLISDNAIGVDHSWETAKYPPAPANYQAGDCDQVIVAPSVTTNSAANITQTSATSGGNVTSDGGATVTARGVCWSTSQNPTTANSKTSNGTGTGSFTSSLTGLSANTTYYVRAYATNSAGTAYGSQILFTTLQLVTIPTITTNSVTSITQNSAASGGNVTSDGGAAVIARGVCWSTSQNPTTANSNTSNGTGTGNYTSSITGLSANTTYYVRAYATNSAGTAYGSQVSFTTSQAITIPAVTTTSVTSITQNSASSGGNVTSDGGAAVTARGVCWSTSQNPTIANSKTTNGSGIGSFTSSLTGLSANTTYYVRAYATNSAGTAYGSQVSFTTQSGSGLTWVTSKSAAVSAALSQGKKILILAGRDTCGYTTYMRDTVCEMTNPPIKNVIQEYYIPWFCHVDNSTEWYTYASGLGIFYLPLICRIDPSYPASYIDRSTNIQDANIFYHRLLNGINIAGDINCDGKLDLVDLILALQVCSGITGLPVNLNGEVNGDNRIGLEDAIYMIRELSGITK